jgi:hypothetical protein
MKITKLWDLPVLSSEVDKISVLHNGCSITITGYNINGGEKYRLHFDVVLCYRHTSERFTKHLYDSYDTLVEIEESDWLKKLKQLNEDDFSFWKPRHYAIYLDSVGLYEIISNNYLTSNE